VFPSRRTSTGQHPKSPITERHPPAHDGIRSSYVKRERPPSALASTAGFSIFAGEGSGANFNGERETAVFAATSSSGKDCPPNSGHSGIFESQAREMDLSLANAMRQLDSRVHDGRVSEAFDAEHRVDPGLDVATISLDQIVQASRRSQRRVSLGKISSAFISRTAR
jgi:hypothetical protein